MNYQIVKKFPVPEVDPEEFDSDAEREMWEWVCELLAHGYLKDAKVHPRTFCLVEGIEEQVITKYKRNKVKGKDYKITSRTLLNGHSYTPDLYLAPFTNGTPFIDMANCLGWICTAGRNDLITPETGFYIEVKSLTYSKYNNHREFAINQKWMWEKHHVYVNRVDPRKLFRKTFCPVSLYFMKNRKDLTIRKPFANCHLLSERRGGLFRGDCRVVNRMIDPDDILTM